MRCKICDYRLWNLRSRQCPECGTPFRPSEFEFVVNSVQFCCPHCNRAYYGTGPQGHLIPTEFDCTSCSAHIHMDEMVLLPAEGLEEEQTEVEQMPWLNRSKRGVVRGWFSTVGMALVGPGRLMRLTPLHSSTASAWWFTFFTHMLLMLVGVTPFVVLSVGIGLFGGLGATPGFMEMGIGASMGGVFLLGAVAVAGLITHGLLMMTGKTAGGLGRTYHAICYSSGANVVMLIPCLGWYLGWVWWVVSAVLMVRQGQKVGGARAALAVLTFPLLSIAGFIAFSVWAVTFSATPTTTFGTGATVGSVSETRVVLDAVLNYAEQHAGQGPDHAIQLVDEDFLAAWDLLVVETDTQQADVPLGQTSLDGFAFLTRVQKDRLVRESIAALPDGIVAHRLGDFVFTYHGMDLATANNTSWVVIMWPDPDVNDPPPAGSGFCVGWANGTVNRISTKVVAEYLASENRLRAGRGLLPHPDQVTHAKPACGR
ncbi:MAG: YIP1 family protein [Phycisphaerae bacterium]|nr:YIP1 family protein [Phycisphaerae bacterium]